jgi:hypothetical protein
MDGIIVSPFPYDAISRIPTDLSLTDYLFKNLSVVLPQVAKKPWLVRKL